MVSPPGVNAGRETAGVKPTASAYFRYVSMEATTTRASIVIRSIPTREIRTHASITIPLSRTRSRTSIKLVPPGALSTAILVRFLFSRVKRAYARSHVPKCSFTTPLCSVLPGFLCATSVFSVWLFLLGILLTTETQRTQRLHREDFRFRTPPRLSLSTSDQTTDYDASYLLCAPHGDYLQLDSPDWLRRGCRLRVSGFRVPVPQAVLAAPRFRLQHARRVSSGSCRNATSSNQSALPYRSSKPADGSAT